MLRHIKVNACVVILGVSVTIMATMLQHSAVRAEEPAVSTEPVEGTQEEQPAEESGTTSASAGERAKFNIMGVERPSEPILAYDVESLAQVDREDSSADFWLKSNDSQSPGSSYGIEALNGALVAPEYVGQPPDSVPESAFVAFGADVSQDQTLPCKTSSGQLCELSAHYYEVSAGGSDVVVTITLH